MSVPLLAKRLLLYYPYPQDILSIITDRKKATAVGSGSFSARNDGTLDPALPSAQNLIGTSKPALSSAPSSSNQLENSSAIGKWSYSLPL